MTKHLRICLANGKERISLLSSRKTKGIPFEINKESTIRLLQHLKEKPEMSKLSLQGHFFGYGIGKENIETLNFKRYLYLQNETSEFFDFESFIKQLRDPKSVIGIESDKKFLDYLKVLVSLNRRSTNSASGIVINVSADQSIHSFPFDAYDSMNLSLKIVPELIRQQIQKRDMGGRSMGL